MAMIVCPCLPCKRLHRAEVTIIAPLEDSQIQWLAMARDLQHAVRSWIKPVDWLQPATSNFPSEREKTLVAFAYHLSLLAKGVKGLPKAIFQLGKMMPVVEGRSSELLECLKTLRALKPKEAPVGTRLPRRFRRASRRTADPRVEEVMGAIHNRHCNLEVSVRAALKVATLVQEEVK